MNVRPHPTPPNRDLVRNSLHIASVTIMGIASFHDFKAVLHGAKNSIFVMLCREIK